MTSVLVDTNILIYSVDTLDPKHAKAIEQIERLIENGELVISSQNLAEFSHVLLEKAQPKQKYEDVLRYMFKFRELAQVINYGVDTVINAVTISDKCGLHFFDALLVATMQENGISKILTENTKDFEKVEWLEAVSPF